VQEKEGEDAETTVQSPAVRVAVGLLASGAPRQGCTAKQAEEHGHVTEHGYLDTTSAGLCTQLLNDKGDHQLSSIG
jgi:hypothetical protein